MTADKTREEELKKRAYQTLNQKDYGEWCFAEGRRLQKIEDDKETMKCIQDYSEKLRKEGRRQALADVEKIIDEFWLKADGILGNSYREELISKIKKLQMNKTPIKKYLVDIAREELIKETAEKLAKEVDRKIFEKLK